MEVSKINIVIIILLVAVVLLLLLRPWTVQPEPNAPIIIRTKDTVQIIQLPTPIIIRDTIKEKQVVIKDFTKEPMIKELLRQRDSLAQLLKDWMVTSTVTLDTIHSTTKDTVKVSYEEFSQVINVYWGLAPRKVDVQKEIIYLPPPKREWWDSPLVGGLGGFILGATTGVIVGVSISK